MKVEKNLICEELFCRLDFDLRRLKWVFVSVDYGPKKCSFVGSVKSVGLNEFSIGQAHSNDRTLFDKEFFESVFSFRRRNGSLVFIGKNSVTIKFQEINYTKEVCKIARELEKGLKGVSFNIEHSSYENQLECLEVLGNSREKSEEHLKNKSSLSLEIDWDSINGSEIEIEKSEKEIEKILREFMGRFIPDCDIGNVRIGGTTYFYKNAKEIEAREEESRKNKMPRPDLALKEISEHCFKILSEKGRKEIEAILDKHNINL